MGVDDGPEGLVIAAVDAGLQGLAGMELLPHAFIDQHVGVHRHAHRQDDTGDARQGEGGAEQGQHPQKEDDVDHQGVVGHQPGEAVVEDHEAHHQEGADEAGGEALLDGVGPQGGAHGDVLDDLDGGRQGPGPQDNGQVGGFLGGIGPGDLGLAAADALLDHRRRAHHAVQDDGQAALDVLPGDLAELRGPPAIEVHRDVRLVIVADAHRGVLHRIAGEQDLLFQQQRLALDAAGLPVDALFDIDLVLRRNLVGQGLVELFPGVAGFELAGLEGLFDQLRQIETGLVVHQFKFQLGGLADEVQGPLGVLDAGKLHHDIVGALAHQDRLGHAKLVDAVAQHLQALGYGAFLELLDFLGFELEFKDQAAVPALGPGDLQMRELLLHQPLEGGLFVFVVESNGKGVLRNVSRLQVQAALFGQFLQVGGGAAQVIADGLVHVHLEDQVHAPFQIQTQIQPAADVLLPPVRQLAGQGRQHEDDGNDGEDKEEQKFQADGSQHALSP